MLVMVALPSYAKALSSQKVIDFIMKKKHLKVLQ